MPRNIATETTPRMARVPAAFLAWGRRNAGTPFEMASTPVSAVEPDANARRMKYSPIAAVALPVAMACTSETACGHAPPRHRATPTATRISMDRMNP